MGKVKNESGFLVALKACSRKPPAPEVTVVVLGSFTLAPGADVEPLERQAMPSGDRFAQDDEERLGGCSYASDFADFKLNAEALLTGSCHTPGRAPLAECPVRFSVGAWSKTLKVSGARAWSDALPGAVMSKPLPFTAMPLGWANAFGGPGYAKNPSGKGHKSQALPNVESAAAQVRRYGDVVEPVGFGPINPAWPSRQRKLGKAYGKAWRETRSPWFAEDFDWSYFSAAPADQQLDGYLRGDEEIGFVNLHPDAPQFTKRLPGVRVRAFLLGTDGTFREVAMSLDTVHADLDAGVLRLTWRGVAGVRETDLADVHRVHVVRERLADTPLTVDRYRRRLAEIENDPLVGKEGVLSRKALAEMRRIQADHGELIEAATSGGAAVQPDEPLARRFAERLGPSAAKAQRAQIDRLAGAMTAAKQALAKLAPDAKIDLDAKVAEAVAAGDDLPPMARVAKPGAMPDTRLRERIRQVMAVTEKLKKTFSDAKLPLPEQIAALDHLPHDPRLKLLDPDYEVPGPLSTDAPGPGADLTDRDLSGADLSGVDLTGAKLDGALLVKTKLAGAKVCGASLRRAVLYKADLTGADLTGADLTRVNAAKVTAKDANLSRTTLDLGYFDEADLTGAKLEGARGEFVVLTGAKLDRARATDACLPDAQAGKASLRGAVLTRATLERARLVGADLAGADLRGAHLGRARFRDADLTGASLVEAAGDRTIFSNAKLDGACLTLAVLPRAMLDGASLVGAVCYGADLREARFFRASLERANLTRANLFRATLTKTRLGGAKLREASLYGATLVESGGADCDLYGAVLTASSLERA